MLTFTELQRREERRLAARLKHKPRNDPATAPKCFCGRPANDPKTNVVANGEPPMCSSKCREDYRIAQMREGDKR
jgi:hypothetical protein